MHWLATLALNREETRACVLASDHQIENFVKPRVLIYAHGVVVYIRARTISVHPFVM